MAVSSAAAKSLYRVEFHTVIPNVCGGCYIVALLIYSYNFFFLQLENTLQRLDKLPRHLQEIKETGLDRPVQPEAGVDAALGAAYTSRGRSNIGDDAALVGTSEVNLLLQFFFGLGLSIIITKCCNKNNLCIDIYKIPIMGFLRLSLVLPPLI